MEIVKKGNCVELEFSGFTNDKLFDSNIEEDLKKEFPEAEAKKLFVFVGEGMLVPGFDKSLEGKEIGKEYEITVSHKEAFGERKKELVKIIPLNIFTKQNINPRAGMTLFLDNNVAKVIAVSGARVTTDFNYPLAGKDLFYKFKIKSLISEETEKSKIFFEHFLRFVPEFEVGEKVTIKGEKALEGIVGIFKDKFKELVGKELSFELKEKQS